MKTLARKRRLLYWLMLPCLVAGAIAVSGFAFLAPSIGSLPEGDRLRRIERSPNYHLGEFRNQVPTSVIVDKSADPEPEARLKPSRPLPMIKTDLHALDRNRDLVVWLGHSSYFIQLGGKRILIDPVFSEHLSPIPLVFSAFDGDYPYSVADIPEIDVLLISHDHWDHLDRPTLLGLQPRIKRIICPLGVGAHLERWGFASSVVTEADWNQKFELGPGFAIHVLPARHFSGRALTRNKSLWAGYLLASTQRKIFYSGDSGYGPHFADTGRKFGPIDLAIMDNGQYDPRWAQIHMAPEEVSKATSDLKARALLPGHSGRFSLANHAWDDPYRRVELASRDKPFTLMTPRIGDLAWLDEPTQSFAKWWEQSGPRDAEAQRSLSLGLLMRRPQSNQE
ncbi:MBL fold metallo-hydrolase [Lysobacter sp. KIS68-7]|uniref:MBL fold metallo-hydrolase n=1 Tax=Lysobacter sp. KIS68-7 TaxID=2904252 RepID=UPI001E59D05E|nr:MBL fold metallo-hydrolase [Lysobacter sp. KIS68-7]UHQ19015.1 MBL fold metallo-hydrolase [Lysobacter sp. KIS68-7]